LSIDIVKNSMSVRDSPSRSATKKPGVSDRRAGDRARARQDAAGRVIWQLVGVLDT
jgi:hypothetical protein